MLNGFLVWFNVFLLNPNPGEPFSGPLCDETDYIKPYKTRQDYTRNLKIDTIVEAPIYIIVYIFIIILAFRRQHSLKKKQVFNERCTYFRMNCMSDVLNFSCVFGFR